MAEILEQLQTDAFWKTLLVVLPIVSGVLSQILGLVESGEISASQAQRRTLELTARGVASAIRFVNQGPGSWRKLLLAAMATAAALLQGCAGTQAQPTIEQIQSGVDAFCVVEGDRLLDEVLDPDALAQAQEAHELWCDVMLSLIETRGVGVTHEDLE